MCVMGVIASEIRGAILNHAEKWLEEVKMGWALISQAPICTARDNLGPGHQLRFESFGGINLHGHALEVGDSKG